MLIVAGSFMVEPEQREEFLRQRTAAMETSRAERGCLDYVFSADPLVPGRVLLFERWEDKTCLAEHLAALRSSPPAAAGDPVPVLSAEVHQYEISAIGPVGS